MPDLQWHVYEFIECLEVLPQTDEYETKHVFDVERDGLRLQVSVWQYESVIHLDLYRVGAEEPVIGCAFYVRGKITRERHEQDEYLDVQDCLPVPSRFSYLDFRADLYSVESTDYHLALRLRVNPHIRIEYVRHRQA